MADQLHKPLTGQYAFTVDADRAATVKNLYLGGNAAAITITTNAGVINGATSSTFTATNDAATTFTITGTVDGQRIKVIFTSTASGAVTNVFTGMTGVSASIDAGKIVLYDIVNAGGTIYFTQTALS